MKMNAKLVAWNAILGKSVPDLNCDQVEARNLRTRAESMWVGGAAPEVAHPETRKLREPLSNSAMLKGKS